MGIAPKVLGQSSPSATTLTDIYTVPSATSAAVSSGVICNRNGSADSFRVSVAPAGASDSNEQYIYYDVPISGKDTFIFTVGITLATTDVVRVYSTNGYCSFNLFGSEVS